jgi:tritrans,polycis-undecaprenyl-diphosphate synthase [geranylgeranyl-diphosphate specific]
MVLRGLLSSLGVYGIYHRWLRYQIGSGRNPDHIGVILDGNRRWATAHDLNPWEGHYYGAEKVKDFLKWCLDLNIKTVTLYLFSTENFQRSKKEVDEIMKVGQSYLDWMRDDETLQKYRVRIKVLGRIGMLPENIQQAIKEIEDMTKDYDNYYLNLAIAYGGRAEIVDAAKQITKMAIDKKINPDDIDEAFFEKYLYTSHLPHQDPDLIIRTSGESRLSGFLLWQSAYSEFCFIDVYWPGFREIDLERAIRTYQRRERRHGI